MLGLLLTDDTDFSLRSMPLLAGLILLPIRISRSVSSCTILSSVAMPLASTHTGVADNAPPTPAHQPVMNRQLMKGSLQVIDHCKCDVCVMERQIAPKEACH